MYLLMEGHLLQYIWTSMIYMKVNILYNLTKNNDETINNIDNDMKNVFFSYEIIPQWWNKM